MTVTKSKSTRLAAYTDGILAVVATLLVFGIAVPGDHEFQTEGISAFLFKLRHEIGAYALSFLYITSYWIQHHVIYAFLERATRRFIWLNGVFLFFVTLIPFATKLVSTYRHDYFVVLLYGVLQVICGALLVVLWFVAHEQRQSMGEQLDPRVKHSMTLRIMTSLMLDVTGVVVAPFSVPAAIVCFLAAPLLTISHQLIDRTLLSLSDS